MNGEILLFGVALRNLGLDDWGFSYKGKGGGTVQSYIGAYFDILLPGIDVGTARMHFGYLTSGDQRHGSPHRAFPTVLFAGQLPGEERKGCVNDLREFWTCNRMNGVSIEALPGRGNPNKRISKMGRRLWFELAHKLWPDDSRFLFALQQFTAPGASEYLPSPYFLIRPVRVEIPPPTAPSFWAPERGIAMLRADESPNYWTGPAPAVALRGANQYVHEVADSFAITNFHAFNRMLLASGQTCNDYASNDPDFSASIRSHTAVMVDEQNPGRDPAAQGELASYPEAKFIALRGRPYTGIEQTRALVLTREYLLDVSHLAAADIHRYVWLGQPLGRPRDAGSWPSYDITSRLTPKRTSPDMVKGAVFEDGRRLVAGERPWSVTMLQDAGPGVEKERVPAVWWQRGIGVRVQMAGAADTEVMIGKRPQYYQQSSQKINGKYESVVDQESEAFGASTIAVARTTKVTTFIALWEPFERGSPAGLQLEVAAETAAGVVARVVGRGWTDVVAIRLGKSPDQSAEIAVAAGRVGVASHGWLRLAGDKATVRGGWSDRERALELAKK